jgi:hypothetical protein
MELIEIVPECLFPRLTAERTHPIYQRDLGRHMYRTQHQDDEISPIIQIHMVEDISLQFVVEKGMDMQFLREIDREDLPAWDDMALIARAFLNLRDLHGDAIQLQQLEGGAFRVSSPGQHDASFLLLGNFWATMVEQLGENMYAAAPSHHLLFVAPQNDLKGILRLQTLVRDTFVDLPTDRLLSKAIYQRWDGEWKIVATAF